MVGTFGQVVVRVEVLARFPWPKAGAEVYVRFVNGRCGSEGGTFVG